MSANAAKLTVMQSVPSARVNWFTRAKSGDLEFHGESYEDHIAAWEDAQTTIDGGLWGQALIAASLERRYGDKSVERFAHEVHRSAQWIRDMALAYRIFGEKQSQLGYLTFTHHVVAAKAAKHSTPEIALQKAHDGEWSTKQLQEYVEKGVEPQPKPKTSKQKISRALQTLARETLANHIEFVAIPALIELQGKCPDATFSSKFYGNFIADLREHRQVLLDEETQHAILTAWELGHKTEDQLAGFTKTDLSEVRRVMLQLEEDGYFVEQPLEWKPDQAKGGRSKIWRRTSKPLPIAAN